MFPNHQRQVDEGVGKSLTRAGIRPAYHARSLSKSPSEHGPRLFEWTEDRARDPVRGWTIIGGNGAEDLTVAVARNLHLAGTGVRVMTFLRFVEQLRGDRPYLEATISEVKTLVLLKAGPFKPLRAVEKDDTFTTRELRSAEDRLEDWMHGNARLLVHAPLPLANGWFSPQFVQRVATVNDELVDLK